MPTLQALATIRTYLANIVADTSENAQVRAKAAEVLALFDPPRLAEIQSTFTSGSVAQKLGALGQLQSALIRGELRGTGDPSGEDGRGKE